jgi:hypothetical protein
MKEESRDFVGGRPRKLGSRPKSDTSTHSYVVRGGITCATSTQSSESLTPRLAIVAKGGVKYSVDCAVHYWWNRAADDKKEKS